MTQRRSLTTAMEITPEKLAFIQGAAPIAPQPPSEPSTHETVPLVAPTRKRSSIQQQPRSTPKDRDTEEHEASLLGVLLVPLTTRLQPVTADALRRAYLEQKLRGRRPDTQQEIVEAALQSWLRKEGFL